MRGSWERRFAAVVRSTLARRFEGLAGMQRWVSLRDVAAAYVDVGVWRRHVSVEGLAAAGIGRCR